MSITVLAACYFITWVITSSKFPLVAIPRDKFADRWATWDASADPDFVPDPKVSLNGKPTNLFMRSLSYLWECAWCMGFWVSLVYHGIADKIGSVPFTAENVLATAAGVGITASLVSLAQSWERRDDH